ncbi:MAG: PAS domain S-box protein [Nitrosospira sp.]|nr:PAS domain S-box protein [Nitrosospira sp.]
MISPTKSHAGTIASIAEISRETADLPHIENEHIRIASILEQSLNEIYLFDTQTLRFEYVNKCAQRNLGYSMDMLRMMTPMDIKPDFDEVSLRIMADPLLRGEKEVLIFRTVHLRADGTSYPVEVHLQLFEQSGWLGFLAMVLDIAVRCRAEAALRESEAWFRTIVNTIPQLAWIAAADGSRSWYNQRWYDYTGTTPQEMIGHGWQKVHDPHMLPKVIRSWKDSTAAEHAFDMEFPLRGADGQFRIFLTRAEPLKNSEGHVVQWFGTNMDVNEQRLRERAHRETEQQLQVVTENMGEGLVISDFTGQLLQWNPAALKMYGISAATDVLLQIKNLTRMYELSTIQGIVVPIDEWPLTRVLRGEHLHDLELRVRRFDEDWERILSYSGAVSHYGNGQGLAFLTIQDITERKNVEEALRDAKINLEWEVSERTGQLLAKSKELENFCYSVSHDLRAPLRGIDGYSRLLLEDYYEQFDEEGRSFLKNVRAATNHMTDLIKDLLAYSRLERRETSTKPIELSSFVSDLLDRCHTDSKNVCLTVEVGNFHVSVDSEGLTIALRNLIDNAIKFSKYSPAPTIEIRAQVAGNRCIFSIRDNGIGFDMRFYDKIFEIFQRLHRAKEYPGTGIGLAMVQKAMERMGGRVWAESQLGAGAIFYLELPLSSEVPTITDRIQR